MNVQPEEYLDKATHELADTGRYLLDVHAPDATHDEPCILIRQGSGTKLSKAPIDRPQLPLIVSQKLVAWDYLVRVQDNLPRSLRARWDRFQSI